MAMIRCAYALLFLFPAPSFAEVFLETGGFSYHFGVEKEALPETTARIPYVGRVTLPAEDEQRYNEINPGLGVRVESDYESFRAVYVFGEYLNSIRETSYYAGAGLSKKLFGNDYARIDIGAVAGGVSGYSVHAEPVALPFVRIVYEKLTASFMAMPSYGEAPATLMLTFAFRLI